MGVSKATRGRKRQVGKVFVTVCLGLASRSRFGQAIAPLFVGDILYATMMFFVVGLLLPRTPAGKIAGFAIVVCFGIEFLQLYQADWLTQLRATPLGALILGHGFLAADLLCYLIGVALGYFTETFQDRGRVCAHSCS